MPRRVARRTGAPRHPLRKSRDSSSQSPESRRCVARLEAGLPQQLSLFLLTLEDKSRFKKSRTVGAFIGLRPRKDQSGDTDKQLPITKAGDPFLRRLLVNCANQILGPFGKDTDLRRWGLELASRGGKNAKRRATVAVARKLAVLMHRLWVTGEEYQPVGYEAWKKNITTTAAS